jgi:hypothetical protein
MSETDFKHDPAADVTTAVQALLPEMRQKSRKGWLLIALTTVMTVGISYLVATTTESSGKGIVFFPAIGILLITAIVRRTCRAHESAVMPILARTVGLDFSKDAQAFDKSLPARLLPEGDLRMAEDLLSGTFGGRAIRLAEVKVETGGKNSRILFKGVVANFPNAVVMPPFFIAPEGQTGKSFWSRDRLDVDGLVRIRTVTGRSGLQYGVWASSLAVADNPALGAVLAILTDLEHRVGGDTKLFSATSNGEVTHVALSHERDLYKIGGLLMDQTKIFDDVQAAYRDLTVPLTIATQLMEAEKNVGESTKKL